MSHKMKRTKTNFCLHKNPILKQTSLHFKKGGQETPERSDVLELKMKCPFHAN